MAALCCVYMDVNILSETFGHYQAKQITTSYYKLVNEIEYIRSSNNKNNVGRWDGKIYVIPCNNLKEAKQTAFRYLTAVRNKNLDRHTNIPIKGCVCTTGPLIPYEKMMTTFRCYSSREEVYVVADPRPQYLMTRGLICKRALMNGGFLEWPSTTLGINNGSNEIGRMKQNIKYYVVCASLDSVRMESQIIEQDYIIGLTSKLPSKLLATPPNSLLVIYSTMIDLNEEAAIFDTAVSKFVRSMYAIGLLSNKLLIISQDLHEHVKINNMSGETMSIEALVDGQVVYTFNQWPKQTLPIPLSDPIIPPIDDSDVSTVSTDVKVSENITTGLLEEMNTKLDIVLNALAFIDTVNASSCVGKQLPLLMERKDRFQLTELDQGLMLALSLAVIPILGYISQ
jgi:hypothetical protein